MVAARIILGFALLALPGQSEWRTLFNCEGDSKTDDRVKAKNWQELAKSSVGLRICTAGSTSQCVYAKPGNSGLSNLRGGNMSLQKAGRGSCNRDCINNLWAGPSDLLNRLTWTCNPQFGNSFYHACGNHAGLHMWRNKAHCEWDWEKTSSLVVQVDYVAPPLSEWKTIFNCDGDGKTDNRFTAPNWQVFAQKASYLRICTKGSNTECVVATPQNVALRNIRNGFPHLQQYGQTKCDANCIKTLWSGSNALLKRLSWTCTPQHGNAFYHACGNHDGLHMWASKSHCEWDWQKSSALVVQVDYTPAPPTEWRTVFHCAGDSETKDRTAEDDWQKLAHLATGVRICTAFDTTKCVVATNVNSALHNLRKGELSLQASGRTKCDYNCIKNLWWGSSSLLNRLTWTCSPQRGNAYFHACGNHNGLHFWKDGTHCEWDWQKTSALVVQLELPKVNEVCVEKYNLQWPHCDNVKCMGEMSIDEYKRMCQADDNCDGFSFSAGKTYGWGCLKRNCKGQHESRKGYGKSTHGYYDCTPSSVTKPIFEGMTKIAENVCIGAKSDRFGTFKVPYDFTANQVRIVHRSGFVQCRSYGRACDKNVFGTSGNENRSFFGCECNANVNVQVTDASNRRVVPGNNISVTGHSWYYLPGFHSHSDELVFDGKKSFQAGEAYRLWYGEDLVEHTTSDNHGQACYDIYANVELTCPKGTRQVGTLTTGNDIGGCGFGDCDSWYRFNKYNDVFQCAAGCTAASGCKSFTYTPVDGEKHWMGQKVCTHYSGTSANQNWGPKQIMCVVDQSSTRRRLEESSLTNFAA